MQSKLSVFLLAFVFLLMGCAAENNSRRLQAYNNSGPSGNSSSGDSPGEQPALDLSSLESIQSETQEVEIHLGELLLHTQAQLSELRAIRHSFRLANLEALLRRHLEREKSSETYRSMEEEGLLSDVTRVIGSERAQAKQRDPSHIIIPRMEEISLRILQAQAALVQVELELNQRLNSNPEAVRIGLQVVADLHQRLDRLNSRMGRMDSQKEQLMTEVSRLQVDARRRGGQIAEHLRAHRAHTDSRYRLVAALAGLARNRARQTELTRERARLSVLYDAAIKQVEDFIAKNTP